MPGKDGGDVPPYLEKQVTQLLAELAEIETQQEDKQDDSI
ncbi:MAG: hypothetical protein WBA93_19610 [Microcoleaceae cyanobacterium]|nr:hypothetical protein [Cyanobacteriota bacterium]